MKYRHLFFDLDHTLWDYEHNSRESLDELYVRHGLWAAGTFSKEDFFSAFDRVNHDLWSRYNKGELTRDVLRNKRFRQVLGTFGLEDPLLARVLSEEYLDLCPKKSKLLPYAEETLAYLNNHYELSIITNGFTEIQHRKLKVSNIDHYFKSVTTSDSANSRKPSRAIFDHAIAKAKSKHSESLMIGDNLEADVVGALWADIDAVYFNPKCTPHGEKVTHEIDCLRKLMNIL